jgi:hypothetical protein
MGRTPLPRRLALAVIAALACAALWSTVATSAADPGPTASASVANCNGRSFSVTQRNNLLTSKGTLVCTGDVAKQRLRTCLEQQVGRRFATVKCVTEVRFGPGLITVRAQRRCGEDVARAFRTRSFLFLRDVSGEKARGKVISDLRVFPRRCA